MISIILLIFIIDYGVSKYVSQQRSTSFISDEFEVWNQIFSGKLDAEIAIYGSSRAWVQFDSEIIAKGLNSSCYNFGVDGQNFRIQHLRHLLYLKHNKKPKKIIVSVDYSSLELANSEYHYEQFLPYMLWNKEIYNYTKTYSSFNFFEYLFPLLRFQNELTFIEKANAISKQKDAPKRINGYRGASLEWNKDLEKAKEKNPHFVVTQDTVLINLFNKFIADCKTNNIEVILVYAPIHKVGQAFIKNHDEVKKIFENISKKNNLVYLDFTNDEICDDRKYFYNSGHMNKLGAEKFTHKLVEELIKRKPFQ